MYSILQVMHVACGVVLAACVGVLRVHGKLVLLNVDVKVCAVRTRPICSVQCMQACTEQMHV